MLPDVTRQSVRNSEHHTERRTKQENFDWLWNTEQDSKTYNQQTHRCEVRLTGLVQEKGQEVTPGIEAGLYLLRGWRGSDVECGQPRSDDDDVRMKGFPALGSKGHMKQNPSGRARSRQIASPGTRARTRARRKFCCLG
jgi:hypothetical protein